MMLESSGFILIDKPPELSSFDVIRRLRKVTGIRSIGHSGTLDPFATGLLICALGSYTRLCSYLEVQSKSYSATLKLGEQTATGDTEGEIVLTDTNIPQVIAEKQLAKMVLGLTELAVPAYSAIKVQGKPAYAYARQGIKLNLAKRPTQIHAFQLQSYDPPFLSYTCQVSKGTYIRSLGEFIAQTLGTVAHTIKLCRTSIGEIGLEASQQLAEISSDNFRSLFYPASKLLSGYPAYQPEAEELAALRNGQSISQSGEDCNTVMLYDTTGRVVGVAKRESGLLSPVINLQ